MCLPLGMAICCLGVTGASQLAELENEGLLLMSDGEDADAYLRKAIESLAGAQSELANGRFNNAANRAYYAAFQAVIAALLDDGIRTRTDRWAHKYVQSEFAGTLINQRRRYSSDLRNVLSDLQRLRHDADYRAATIHRVDADLAIRRSRDLVDAIRLGRGRR